MNDVLAEGCRSACVANTIAVQMDGSHNVSKWDCLRRLLIHETNGKHEDVNIMWRLWPACDQPALYTARTQSTYPAMRRLLINEINANHEGRTPEALARNQLLIRELNGNMAKVSSSAPPRVVFAKMTNMWGS